jgi:DNA topoisomerase-1
LKQAVANPLFIRMNIVKAQQTRQIIDRMIGFRISPVLSRLVSHEKSNFLSAGRCQTPTLKLIYDRKIENDKKSNESIEYKLTASFFPHPSILSAGLNSCLKNTNEVEHFLETSKTFEHIFSLNDKKMKTNTPPTPFKTSLLLQTANSLLHMSPKYVMEACQTLYQDGKITYMRTESTTYAKGFLTQCKSFIEGEYGASYVGKLDRLENTENNNPHEAIRVTHVTLKQTDYEDKKINDIYNLIRKRTLESCMNDFQYDQYNIEFSAPYDHNYTAAVDIPTFLGWKRVSTKPEEMIETQIKLSNDVLYWKRFQSKPVPFTKIDGVLHMIERDRYYNEASLIQKLETLGIGRPSTFSMLTDTIQERKYVVKQDIQGAEITGKEYTLTHEQLKVKEMKRVFGASKNKLCIQDLGIQVISKLDGFQSLFEYSYTSLMETELDEIILNPEKDWREVCKNCDEMITTCLTPLNAKIKKKYEIDEFHSLIFGKSGIVVQCSKEGEEKTYKTVKKELDVDFDKLENKEYSLEDILEIKNECLGKFENEDVLLKTGKYGPYITYGNTKLSVKSLVTKEKPLDKLTMADLETFIIHNNSTKESSSSSVLRVLSDHASVRKGKFGNYIFYKTAAMKKPSFINLTNCPFHVLEDEAEKVCQWIKTNLKVE